MTFNTKNLPLGWTLFPVSTYYSDDQFYGRENDINRIIQILDSGSSVALSGKRRIGHTWLLQRLGSGLPNNRYVFVPGRNLSTDTFVPRQTRMFLHTLIYELSAILSSRTTTTYSYKTLDLVNPPVNLIQTFRNDIDAIHHVLASLGLAAVIPIDEVEGIYEFTDDSGVLPAIIRSLATEYKHLRVIVAGWNLTSPTDHRPPLFNAFTFHQLHGIGSVGASRLVAGTLAKYNVKFATREDWRLILLLTGEEPVWLRLMGQQLTEQARANNGLIGRIQINEAVEAFFKAPEVDLLMRDPWMRLGINEPIQSILTVLAYNATIDEQSQRSLIEKVKTQFYSTSKIQHINRDIQRLCDLGFLIEQKSTGLLVFSNDLLRQWICANQPNLGV